MNRRLLFAAAALVATLALVPAPGAGAAPALSVGAADTTTPGRVQFTVSVPSELAGRRIPASAWTVRESGRRVPVRATAVPTDDSQVVLTIDTSGSMRGSALAAAQEAAHRFVNRMPASVAVGVVAFGDTPRIVSPLSTDRSATHTAIDQLTAGGETAFHDGVVTATGMFPAGGDHSVVALTDGKDTASSASLDAAAARLTDTSTSYYGVALATGESDLQAVRDLARLTSGQATTADQPGALNAVYRDIASRITSRYRLDVPATRTGSTGFEFSVTSDGVTATGASRVVLPAAAATPAAPAPVRTTEGESPAWYQSSTVLWLGLGILAVGLAVGFALVFAPRTERSQLEGNRLVGVRNRTSVFTNLSEHATQIAERQLARNDRGTRLNRALARAGLAIRPSEFTVILAAATFATFAAFLVLIGPLAAIVLGAAVPLVARGVLAHLGERRSGRFQDQLEQTIPLMAGNLRAGFGIMQAFDAVARESDAPTADEFHRVVVETRLGRDLDDALGSLADRVDSEDFDWVVQAIEIHRQVGGDLAEVLDNVYATIRDRNRIRRQIKALSAEGRLSALILFILPVGMFGVISVLNPTYLGELTGSTLGLAMLAVAGGLLVVGGLWLRRIVRLVF